MPDHAHIASIKKKAHGGMSIFLPYRVWCVCVSICQKYAAETEISLSDVKKESRECVTRG